MEWHVVLLCSCMFVSARSAHSGAWKPVVMPTAWSRVCSACADCR